MCTEGVTWLLAEASARSEIINYRENTMLSEISFLRFMNDLLLVFTWPRGHI